MKVTLKKLFNSQSTVYKLLQQVYHYRYWHLKVCHEDTIQKSSTYNINSIQVGFSSSKHNKPLYEYILTKKWRGILIEPIPYLFEELKKTTQKIPTNYFLKTVSSLTKKVSQELLLF